MYAGIHPHFNRWLYLLALLAGGVSVFAFAPFNIYPLAFITPTFLFYTLTKASTQKQYFKLSWLFGIGLFGAGASWPFYSIYFFAHAPLALAIIGVALFVILVALLSMGMFGLLAAQFRHTPLYLRLLLFYPASWVFIEWTRSWLFTGFPWLYFGNSLIDTAFSSYAPITGVLGVSLVSVLIAGALLSFIQGNSVERVMYIDHGIDGRALSHRVIVEERFGRSIRFFSALLIVLLTTTAFALQGINWTQKKGKPLTASVLQANISQQEKLDPSKLDWALNRYQSMTLKSLKSDIIVWPETAMFGPFGKYLESRLLPLQKKIKPDQTLLIGGFYINANKGAENSVLALSADSREIYSKRHLVPFGEYIPLLEYIRWMGDWIPYSNINPGENDGTLKVAGELAQMTICYEDAFGAEIIQSLPAASLLINVTHDGWFTGSLQPEQHMQIARMRSLETGRYMIRSTTTGPAGIINEKGKVLATAPMYTQKIISHQVQAFSGSTPYVLWGNGLIIGILSVILLLGFVWNRREQKNGNA